MSHNMKYIYHLRIDNLTSEDNIPYTAYGIVVLNGSTKQVLKSIPDVFLNEIKAEKFVELCNKLELDICHLYDVIEDELG